MALVLKTSEEKSSVSSNLTLSASKLKDRKVPWVRILPLPPTNSASVVKW